MMKDMRGYLWEGLNLRDFAVVAIWPQNAKEAVVLMRRRGGALESYPWCIEYRGSGHYFQTLDAAMEYCTDRNFVQEMLV